MKRNNNILTIGDIHGRSAWKEIIFGGQTEFFFWKQAVEEDYLDHEGKYKFQIDWDKIIFVGDYVDSFNVSNTDILENLKDIILFARTYPELVVLLLGNHDIQYIVPNEWCSGHRPEMSFDLNEIFTKNETLFRIAYLDEIESEYKGKTYTIRTLWTHAGVSYGWYNELIRDLKKPNFKFRSIFEGFENWKIDQLINMVWDCRISNIYNVDMISGGGSLYAGPLWIRPHILNDMPIDGYDQIVGHTPQADIYQYVYPGFDVESNPLKNNILTYVDILGSLRKGYIIKRINDEEED
jgi:hypothetical protein